MERIVVVGASAGGVSALEQLVAGLPQDFPSALVIVLHLPPDYKSLLPGILTRIGNITACDAEDGALLRPGHAYVAIPDHHVAIKHDRLVVRRGPRENGFRPSVDVLFRSAAYAWRTRAIGVVLSGALDDGASGLWAIKYMGGMAVVQRPEDAAYDSMPVHALRRADVDHVVPAAEIGPLLAGLVGTPLPAEAPYAEQFESHLKKEVDISLGELTGPGLVSNLKPTGYTCPDCHGVMFEVPEGDARRFRCHTGHGYEATTLLSRTVDATEASLWDAVRSVQEGIGLLHEVAEDLERRGQREVAGELKERADRATHELETLRRTTVSKAGLVGSPRRSAA